MKLTLDDSTSIQTPEGSLFSDQQIRQIAERDSESIADWVRSTAGRRGISAQSTPNGPFLKAVSNLSDGVVDLDPIEDLLVAMGRAGVISSFQRSLLQVHYLR